jgi:membrane glycosyltransferase
MTLTSAALRALALRRRLGLLVFVVCLVAVAAIPMAKTLSHDGWTGLNASFFGVSLVLLLQVAFGCATAAMGWWVLRFGHDPVRINGPVSPVAPPAELPALAIVMPVYNEEVSRIFQGLRIMYESLQKTGQGEPFDFYILSDTNDTNGWIAEEKAWFELCKQVHGFGRIFYRKQRVPLHNKSGNIADFCRRWGAKYRYMIVLDADSLMTGAALVQLASLMEQHPRVGIIQTSPRPILGQTLFQRMEQFAACVYRPVFAAGANFWQLRDATFWGHNAIVRLQPFMQYCAMPELPEVGPLGRRVLSHDTFLGTTVPEPPPHRPGTPANGKKSMRKHHKPLVLSQLHRVVRIAFDCRDSALPSATSSARAISALLRAAELYDPLRNVRSRGSLPGRFRVRPMPARRFDSS